MAADPADHLRVEEVVDLVAVELGDHAWNPSRAGIARFATKCFPSAPQAALWRRDEQGNRVAPVAHGGTRRDRRGDRDDADRHARLRPHQRAASRTSGTPTSSRRPTRATTRRPRPTPATRRRASPAAAATPTCSTASTRPTSCARPEGGGRRPPRRGRLGCFPAHERQGGGREPPRRRRFDGVPAAAGKAANANLLDGLDWTQIQQVCRTGSVHAVALIRGASNFSATFIDVPESFSCWRGSGKVAARRISEGRYEVILSGAPYNTFCLSAPLVIGSIQNNSNDNNFFSYSAVPCGRPARDADRGDQHERSLELRGRADHAGLVPDPRAVGARLGSSPGDRGRPLRGNPDAAPRRPAARWLSDQNGRRPAGTT